MPTNNATLRFVTLLLIAVLTALSAAAGDAVKAFDQRDFATAEGLLKRDLQADPDNVELLLYLGRSQLALDNAADAARTLERAAELAPDNADVHYRRGEANGVLAGNASLMRAGRYAKVVRQSFERALEIDPTHEGALQGLIIYKLRAPRLLGGGKKDALAMTDRLIELNPMTGQFVRADVLNAMDRNDEAVALLEDLAARHADDPRPHNQLGFIRQNDEDYAGAFDHFRAAAAATAETDEQRNARHMALYQLGRTAVFAQRDEAAGIAALDEYLALPHRDSSLPGSDWASFRLAELLLRTGDDTRANDLLKTALATTTDKNLKRRAKAALKP